MIDLNFRSQSLMIAFPLTVFVFSSNNAFAEVYKWSDARGVTQYASSRAVPNATQATPNEIVNALQTKDVCTSASDLKVNSYLNESSTSDAISSMLVAYNLPKKIDQYKAAFTIGLNSTLAAIPNFFVSNAQAESSEVVQVGLMPAVNISADMAPATGYSTLRVKPTTEVPVATGGAFRIVCKPSHMNNDDPVVYPNQQGAAHHHTFFGNTSVNFKSDLMNFANIGNTTCNGGIMNRSAYWMPSMIDTASKVAVKPDLAIFYYKTGRTPIGYIKVPPKGLRMIAGNSKATSSTTYSKANFTCLSRVPFYGWKTSIPACRVGETMQMNIAFPQCWDGKNLDSPDHQSHMAYTERTLTTANKCPTSHPIALPAVTVNFNYKVTSTNNPASWRLASDNYAASLPGGFSAHADWVNGWDETFITGIVKNCLNKGVDCKAHLLGDGRMYY